MEFVSKFFWNSLIFSLKCGGVFDGSTMYLIKITSSSSSVVGLVRLLLLVLVLAAA